MGIGVAPANWLFRRRTGGPFRRGLSVILRPPRKGLCINFGDEWADGQFVRELGTEWGGREEVQGQRYSNVRCSRKIKISVSEVKFKKFER